MDNKNFAIVPQLLLLVLLQVCWYVALLYFHRSCYTIIEKVSVYAKTDIHEALMNVHRWDVAWILAYGAPVIGLVLFTVLYRSQSSPVPAWLCVLGLHSVSLILSLALAFDAFVYITFGIWPIAH